MLQIDLIDLQTMPDGQNKFILHYQDHLTKFDLLRSITSKRAEEVAHHLLQIFVDFGALIILQPDNGREFTAEIIAVFMLIGMQVDNNNNFVAFIQITRIGKFMA